MRKNARLFVTIAIFCSALSFALEPGQGTDNPFAAYCGEYLFDISAFDSGGTLTVKVSYANGQFFFQSSRSDTADVPTPVEGKEGKFFIDDPDEGHWDIEFLKNAEGKYTRLHLVNEGLGLDLTGDRIEK
ncbi:MAG: hypothetical protein JW843_05000 [Candidatus Aminicenantes bacterium]|nr:hypothetical protein [Candidatus Aminicenantes bacterium]